MPFEPLPEGANLYVVNTLLIIVYMLYVIFGMRAKRIFFLGVRTYETISDPQIWKEANKKISTLMLAFTIPLLIANTIFALLKLPESFPRTILIIFAIEMVSLSVYISKYAQNLAKEKGVEVHKVRIPIIYAIIILILITITLAVVWRLIWHLIFK